MHRPSANRETLTRCSRHSLEYLFLSLVALAASACGKTVATGCDRECLADLADSYLAAVAARDPSAAPLSDEVVIIENIRRVAPGAGLWAEAVATTDYRIYVPDPEAQTIGLVTVIERRTGAGLEPALVAARLGIEDGRIAVIEQLVSAVPPEADRANLVRPRAAMTRPVAEPQRMSRADLSAIAGSYYEALDRSDGSLAPFADDCERLENGMITASFRLPPATFDSLDVNGRSPPPVARDCVGQMSSRRFAYIDSIDNRRIVAVDPVNGLAMGFSHFRQSMSHGPHVMIAADGTEIMWDEQREPYDLPAVHVFKIDRGQIHEVEAIGIFVPYGSPTAPN